MNIAFLLGKSHGERLGVFRSNHTMKISLRLNFTLEMIVLDFSSFGFEFYFNENKMCLYRRSIRPREESTSVQVSDYMMAEKLLEPSSSDCHPRNLLTSPEVSAQGLSFGNVCVSSQRKLH